MSDVGIYQDIACRTGGDIYLGVVGPVRTGKSTFVKRFMETMILPNIDDVYKKERARDELPQSGSGKTITTAEPKFIPENAVAIRLDESLSVSVRLIDCVGYMVAGAAGQYEDGEERMVTTPWAQEEIRLSEAAEKGTAKVISEHSTIGIVITCDETICDIPRENYIPAEERAINELRSIGKPFVVLFNSMDPLGAKAVNAAREIGEKFNVTCLSVNCAEMDESDIVRILQAVLLDFPVEEVSVYLPSWIETLPSDHPLRCNITESLRSVSRDISSMRTAQGIPAVLLTNESFQTVTLDSMDLGKGIVSISILLPEKLYYETVSALSGLTIRDDGDLMRMLSELSQMRVEYERIRSALEQVRTTGYGIVPPTKEELRLESPEIVRQGGKYSVRLKASAPSIHMVMANIETEVTPALGGERASGEIINYLLQEYEGDTGRLWESNLFGKSLYEIAGEGVLSKLKRLPVNMQAKIQHSVARIVNDGSNAMICIII